MYRTICVYYKRFTYVYTYIEAEIVMILGVISVSLYK